MQALFSNGLVANAPMTLNYGTYDLTAPGCPAEVARFARQFGVDSGFVTITDGLDERPVLISPVDVWQAERDSDSLSRYVICTDGRPDIKLLDYIREETTFHVGTDTKTVTTRNFTAVSGMLIWTVRRELQQL